MCMPAGQVIPDAARHSWRRLRKKVCHVQMNKRECLQIDGLWRFCPDPNADGESLGFWKADHCTRLWREIMVPSCFEAGCGGIDFYQGICWYRHTFRLPSAWKSRRIVLRFEGVNYRAKVWLNGELLGENRDGFLPFEFAIHEKARWDTDNVLAVSVDNAHHSGDVPGMHVGWRGYGGILREAQVYTTNFSYIEDLRIVAEPSADGGRIECRVRVRNGQDGTVTVTLHDANSEAPLLALGPSRLNAATATVAGTLLGARPWSPSTPVLYRAVATLREGSRIVDTTETRFGFRRVQAVPEGLLLNGERIYLTGFNRHEDSPRTAMASDLETARRDLEQMKAAGCNFVRLCHYPHHPGELDLCDELGLLSFGEIPLYFWNDAEEGRRTQEARAQSAARQLEKMIARDFNHPSLVFWSVSNETCEEEPEVEDSNRALIRQARALDPSRLCVHVRNRWETHPRFEEDDVICINTYPTLDFVTLGHNPATFDLAGAVRRQRERMDALHRLYPDKPVLITEFGYGSFAGTFGHAFGEDEHARSIEAEFATFDAPWICGATLWCWADHPWPAGRFLNGLAFSPFGVVNRTRRRLAPYWTAHAMFRARQGLNVPPRGVASGTTVVMVRPRLDAIPQTPFPAGYGIRPMTPGDIGLWTDIQRDAEPYLRITDDLFEREFGDDLEAVQWRCYIMTDPKGLGVGTVSAWYNRDFYGEDYGRIHWVAVRPACQGKGLGKAALSYALNRLAQWHARCYLVTSTERIPAIRLYLDFGFEPDFRPANARDAWSELRTRFKHPALERA